MRNTSRRHHRLAIALAGVALILAPLTVGTAAPAFAAAPVQQSCIRSGFFPTSISGRTTNSTKVPLVRTFLEKGVTNEWRKMPTEVLFPHESDDWCVNAQLGSAMKVEYKTPDGTKFLLMADQYALASPSARCEVSGPSAALLDCRASISKTAYDDSRAVFTLVAKSDVGAGPLPTVTCAFLSDRGRPGDLVTGELCRGATSDFDGAARLEGRDTDDGAMKSYACVNVRLQQVEGQQGFSVAARGTQCNPY
jgi:hypothetical protein